MNISECIKNQEEVVRKNGNPYFAPTNGVCWCCNKNIYKNYTTSNGVSLGSDGTVYITGCPHCNRSFCD